MPCVEDAVSIVGASCVYWHADNLLRMAVIIRYWQRGDGLYDDYNKGGEATHDPWRLAYNCIVRTDDDGGGGSHDG